MTTLAAPASYAPLILAASQQYNVPYNILVAQLSAESGFDPTAQSSTGALGMAQFEPATITGLQQIGVLPAGFDPFDPSQAITGQAAYMRYLLNEYSGSIDQALSAYNSGNPTAYLDPSYADGQTFAYVQEINANAGNIVAPSGAVTSAGALTQPLTIAPDTSGLGPQFITDLSADTPVTLKYKPPLLINNIMFQGAKLPQAIINAFIIEGSEVDWSTSECGQATFCFQDDFNFTILAANTSVFQIGNSVTWEEFTMTIAAIEVNQGDAGPQIIVTARTTGVYKLNRKIGYYNWTANGAMSQTQVMNTACTNEDIAFIGEETVKQVSLQRNNLGYDPTGQTIPESSWDMGQRFALDSGFLLFECAGIVYFGSPTWLCAVLPSVPIGWQGSAGNPLLDALQCPDCSMDVDSALVKFIWTTGLPTDPTWIPPPKQIVLQLDRWLGEQVRPGMVINFSGVPGFEGAYLVTECTFPIDGGVEPATVSAISPLDPIPESAAGRQNPSAPTVTGNYTVPMVSPPTPSVSLSTAQPAYSGKEPTNLDFIAMAETAITDKVPYVWDGTAGANVANPSGLDCSGLVQWALSRLGITFPHYSGSQYTAATAQGPVLSLQDALDTPGALLFYADPGQPPGSEHVQISLGNGNAIAETQPGQFAQIVSATSAALGNGAVFSGGALIPGLNYGSGG